MIDNKNICLLAVLKKAFEAFDQEKKGCIGTVMVGTILGMLGHQVSDEALKEIIDEVDEDGQYLAHYIFLSFAMVDHGQQDLC